MNLCNCIAKITLSKEYHYFNEEEKLKTKNLNIFQRLLRNIFGCYSETHLSNVVKEIYDITLHDRQEELPEIQQKYLELIAKAQKLFRDTSSRLLVYPRLNTTNPQEETYERVEARIDYLVEKVDDGSFVISRVALHCISTCYTGSLLTSRGTHVFTIKRDPSQKLITHFPSAWLHRTIMNIQNSQSEFSSESEKLGILHRILSLLSKIHCYAPDYTYDMASNPLPSPNPSPETRNETQRTILKELDWEYQGDEENPLTGESGRRYCRVLHRDARNIDPLRIPKSMDFISLDFARQHLRVCS